MLKSTIIGLMLLISFQVLAPPTIVETSSKVDQIFDSLTIDQRIAQLFMIEVRPTYGPAHLAKVEEQIRKYEVGGIIFFKGDPVQEVELTNKYQKLSKTPLLVAIDGEWGLAMRLSQTISFPYQLGLGAIQDNSIIYDMGREIGRQCKRMGIHVNFAPVIDVNNNPNNPVINYRSFGEDPMNVAQKGWAYASGMQMEGVIACAKHFPGHGDTDVDSHKDLPVINHSMERLRAVEFKPFRWLIDKGVQSVMTAHLYIPAIDNRPKMAVSISDKAINGILREEMGFKGLSFTDALNMQGVAKYHADGELELKALKAGNDILLAPGNIGKAIDLIKKAMKDGSLKESYVWGKVKKILAYKHSVDLFNFKPISTENLIQDLNNPNAKELNFHLAEKELSLIVDEKKLFPLNENDGSKIASIAIGNGLIPVFQQELAKRQNVKTYQIDKDASTGQFQSLLNRVKDYDLVVVSYHKTSKYPPSFGITKTSAEFVNTLPSTVNTIFVDFGNPYNLKYFKNQHCILMAYEDEDNHQIKAAQAIYGEVGVDGTLPVSVGTEYPAGSGITVRPSGSLRTARPEEVGMSSSQLENIDKIAKKAIYDGATPGMQVLVAKENKIVYQKSFGKHTYRSDREVKNSDLYDLASITKVAATTISIMKLVDDEQLSIDDPLGKYLPELKGTNKERIKIRMVMLHKAGLKDWIPFYQATIGNRFIYDSLYSTKPTALHNTYVGNGLYLRDSYKDEIFKQIIESPISNAGKYRYSDLGMMLLKEIIERVTVMPFDQYVDHTFYKPIGANRITFLPLNKFPADEIVPTAYSPDMRKGVVQGMVHDPGAAMLGGVSGHAGLFANAESLARVMQMILNHGDLDGQHYLNPETIEYFTKYQASDSRRGIGWDKPENSSRRINPASDYASSQCFGHSGFTGTIVWVDPHYDLIYIFLSNRVYPDQSNKKLIRNNVRTDIMDVIYKSFLFP